MTIRVSVNRIALEGARLEIGEGEIQLDPSISADGKFSGISESGTAGAALSFGNLCYFNSSSKWVLANASATSSSSNVKLGICILAAAGDTSATKMLLFGKINAAAMFPTMTVGGPLYVGTTGGTIQTTSPTTFGQVIRIVGFGNTADELFFDPSPDSSTVGGNLPDGFSGGYATVSGTTLYYKPAVSNIAYTYVSSAWTACVIPDAGASIACNGLTASTAYYLYGYSNSGTLALELVTTGTATQNGILVKSGDATRLLLAYCYANASGVVTTYVQDASTQLVCNVYNKRWITIFKSPAAVGWSYNSTTWRSADADTTFRVTGCG